MSSTDNKLMRLVARLSEKSGKGDLSWEPDAASDYKFIASFPGYSVAIEMTKASEGPDWYTFSIIDGSGSLLESVTTTEHEERFPWEGVGPDLSALFTEARRRALNVDHALDEILKAL